MRAEVPPAGEAIAASPAHDVAFAADDFARLKIGNVRADGDDFADKFVADDHRHGDRLLRPRVPVVNVQVSPTDAGAIDADEHVVDARLRLGRVFEPEARLGVALDESFHGARLIRPHPRDNRERAL